MPSISPTPKIGFIGLGTMGREMALNLAKAGFSVRAYDVRLEAAQSLEAFGVVAVGSISDAVNDAQIVITMLPDTPDVEKVVYGPMGLLVTLKPGDLVVDMSTIAPEAARRMSTDLARVGIGFMDAPVSGGPMGAKNAVLSIMVGGDVKDFDKALPFLSAMGTTIKHVGACGAGQTIKLCNQLICGINIQAICEAIALARSAGVDLQILRQVLLGGSAASWMLDKLGPAMIDGDTSAGFRIDLMIKDLRLVQEQALALSVPLPATALVTSQYIDAREHGEGSHGNQALFQVYDRMVEKSRG